MSTQNIFIWHYFLAKNIYKNKREKKEMQAKNHVQNFIYTHVEQKNFNAVLTFKHRCDKSRQPKPRLLNWQRRQQTDRLSQKDVSVCRSVLWLSFLLAAILNHNSNASTSLA